MKILGIGVDIIENKRIKNQLKIIGLNKEFIVQKNSSNQSYQKTNWIFF